LKHIVAKSLFAVGRVLALDSTATVRKLFPLDSPTVLVECFVRLLSGEEVGCRFVVGTPTFAAIMPNIGQFLADSFFTDDPALLTTVIRALDRVLMKATKNREAKRQ
jgi:hypothetical protein